MSRRKKVLVRKSDETWSQEWLCWRGTAAIWRADWLAVDFAERPSVGSGGQTRLGDNGQGLWTWRIIFSLEPASENLSRGTRRLRNLRRWEPLPGDNRWRHSRIRRLSVCCSELQTVWISQSAVIKCSYEFQDSKKSVNQSKPCVGPLNTWQYRLLFGLLHSVFGNNHFYQLFHLLWDNPFHFHDIPSFFWRTVIQHRRLIRIIVLHNDRSR
jgi:hypothetical protein